MRVALATCARLPAHEFDDRPLEAALRARGARVDSVPWDDPAVDWSSYDGCLIRTTWDYAGRLEEYVAWAERVFEQIPLFNGPEVVRWNLHKSYLSELGQRGVPVVETVWLERGSSPEVGQLLHERGWDRAFLKPAIGLSARETLRFDADEEGLAAARVHLGRLLPEEDFLLQPYHPSVETLGELSAVFVEGELTHCVRKIPVPGDYRVQDDHGGSDELFEPTLLEVETARAAVAAVENDLLYARVDWLRDAYQEPQLVELELVEPSLFFRHAGHAAERLAEALLERCAGR